MDIQLLYAANIIAMILRLIYALIIMIERKPITKHCHTNSERDAHSSHKKTRKLGFQGKNVTRMAYDPLINVNYKKLGTRFLIAETILELTYSEEILIIRGSQKNQLSYFHRTLTNKNKQTKISSIKVKTDRSIE